jgi:hypothetical protein
MKSSSRLLIVSCLMLASVLGRGITTHCTAIYGNGMGNANCTTTDNRQLRLFQQQRQPNYQIDRQIGRGITAATLKHKVQKYCEQNPGERWQVTDFSNGTRTRGVCPAR